jgi:hypothetical protein
MSFSSILKDDGSIDRDAAVAYVKRLKCGFKKLVCENHIIASLNAEDDWETIIGIAEYLLSEVEDSVTVEELGDNVVPMIAQHFVEEYFLDVVPVISMLIKKGKVHLPNIPLFLNAIHKISKFLGDDIKCSGTNVKACRGVLETVLIYSMTNDNKSAVILGNWTDMISDTTTTDYYNWAPVIAPHMIEFGGNQCIWGLAENLESRIITKDTLLEFAKALGCKTSSGTTKSTAAFLIIDACTDGRCRSKLVKAYGQLDSDGQAQLKRAIGDPITPKSSATAVAMHIMRLSRILHTAYFKM